MSSDNYDMERNINERNGVLSQENSKYRAIYSKIVNRFELPEDKVVALLKNYVGGVFTFISHSGRHYRDRLRPFIERYDNNNISLKELLEEVSKMANDSENKSSSSLVRRLAYIEQVIKPSLESHITIINKNTNKQ